MKSYIYPVNEVADIQVLAGILRGGVGALPTNHLACLLWGEKVNQKGYGMMC